MSVVSKDQEIVATLAEKLGAEITKVAYDDEGNLITLSLAELSLTQLPPEIGLLSHLQELDLSQNQLSELPAEVGQLKSLQKLNLGNCQLREISPEIREAQKIKAPMQFRLTRSRYRRDTLRQNRLRRTTSWPFWLIWVRKRFCTRTTSWPLRRR